jgi:hypothetical protein
MAIGFPARVVAKPPDFPITLTDEQKIEMFRRMVAEMIRYFVDCGLSCETDGNRYLLMKPATTWWRGKTGPWTLQVVEGDVRESLKNTSPGSTQILLSFREIPSDVRSLLNRQHVMWIEIANKAQSHCSNDLGDEVSLFIKRYGVRTLRSPWTSEDPPKPAETNPNERAL